MTYRSDTKALVMAVLRAGPQHGYGIAKAVRELSNESLKLGEGQLYPVLHSLEEAGWVVSNWEFQEGDPPKKVYSLTEGGSKELEDRTKSWMKFSDAVGAVLTAQTLKAEAQS